MHSDTHSPDPRPAPNLKMLAAGEHILDLIDSGKATSIAFIVFLQPDAAGRVSFEADVLGDISSNRLLVLGACEELKELVTK